MNEQQKFIQAFSHLHASENTLQEVTYMANKRNKKSYSPRRTMILVAILVLLISTTIVAYAAELFFDFFAILTPSSNSGPALEEIYGNNISTDKPYMEDYLGNPIARPDMERIALDPQAAEEMIGAYVSAVEGTFTAGKNTFSLCTFMVNDMGMGAFTWTVENPNGIYYKDIGYGMVDFNPASPFSNPVLTHYIGDTSHLCDTFTFLLKAENNSTKLHLVTYFATASSFTSGDTLVWQVKDTTVQIAPVNLMPSKVLTAENGMSVYASYQGMVLKANSQTEIVPHKMLITFTDGTQYAVTDEGIHNQSGALWRKDGNTSYDALLVLFNRLVDPDNISSIEIAYTWRETIDMNESILHTEKLTFLP